MHDRLVKLKVIDSDQRKQEEGCFILNAKESEMFFNAQIFMVYLLTLKKLMVSALTNSCSGRKQKPTKT